MTNKKGSNKKGSNKNPRGRPPKSANRKGKKVDPKTPPPTGINAINFLYDLIINKGGLQGIEKKFHAPVFNAFQIVENDLNRIPDLEKKVPKEEKKDGKK
jgi:hypothetical protein